MEATSMPVKCIHTGRHISECSNIHRCLRCIRTTCLGSSVSTRLSRLRLKCDGTRAETRFRLSAKRTSHLNLRGRQFIRLLATEVRASAVVMLDKPCSEVVWRVLATQSIHQFPLHFLSRESPCAITFQLDSTPALQFSEHFICDEVWLMLQAKAK